MLSLALCQVRAVSAAADNGPIVFGPLSGAVTTSSFVVTCNLAKSGKSCRLCLSPSAGFTKKIFTQAKRSDAQLFVCKSG